MPFNPFSLLSRRDLLCGDSSGGGGGGTQALPHLLAYLAIPEEEGEAHRYTEPEKSTTHVSQRGVCVCVRVVVDCLEI